MLRNTVPITNISKSFTTSFCVCFSCYLFRTVLGRNWWCIRQIIPILPVISGIFASLKAALLSPARRSSGDNWPWAANLSLTSFCTCSTSTYLAATYLVASLLTSALSPCNSYIQKSVFNTLCVDIKDINKKMYVCNFPLPFTSIFNQKGVFNNLPKIASTCNKKGVLNILPKLKLSFLKVCTDVHVCSI